MNSAIFRVDRRACDVQQEFYLSWESVPSSEGVVDKCLLGFLGVDSGVRDVQHSVLWDDLSLLFFVVNLVGAGCCGQVLWTNVC